MSRHESELNAALRMLAEAGPREAPRHVEVAVREAFRSHRGARRSRSGIVVAIAAGAVAASIGVFIWMAPPAAGPPERVARRTVPPPPMEIRESRSQGVRESGVATSIPQGRTYLATGTRQGQAYRDDKAAQTAVPGSNDKDAKLLRPGQGSREKSRRPGRRPATDQLAAALATTTEFVPLPYGDDTLVRENTRIVRMELPGSALRLAGFSVAQERANDRVQADVVLGADGLAHAVRFVRYTQ